MRKLYKKAIVSIFAISIIIGTMPFGAVAYAAETNNTQPIESVNRVRFSESGRNARERNRQSNRESRTNRESHFGQRRVQCREDRDNCPIHQLICLR